MIRDEFYVAPELAIDTVPGTEFVSFDSTDPIDSQLIGYHNSITTGEFLDASDQEALIRGVCTGEGRSIQKFVDAYAGLVATVAYGYKQYGIDSKELMIIGSESLVQLAETYGSIDISQFDNRAVFAIETAILEMLPGAPRIFADKSQGEPMEQVHDFLEGLTPSVKQEEQNQRILDGFAPMQRKVLSLLHLGTHQAIADAMGPPASRVSVNDIAAYIQREYGLHNTPSLALMLHGQGYRYPIKAPDKPLVESLTDAQFEVGNLLHHEYDEIGRMVGKTEAQVRSAVHKMRKKTGAGSRTEMALIIAMYDTGERRQPEKVLERKLGELAARVGLESLAYDEAMHALAELEPNQREALTPFYITGRETSWKEVAGQLDITEKAAKQRAEEAFRAMRNNLS